MTSPETTLRYKLFRGFNGCSNRDCVIEKNTGVCTNSTCTCIKDMNRSQLNILSERVKGVLQENERGVE